MEANDYVSKRKIRSILREKLPDKARMSVSTDAVGYMYDIVNVYILKLVDEAVRSNYSVIKPIDVKRAKNKLAYEAVEKVLN